MAKNVTIAGASYTDVPAVDLPQTGGGTATFTDVSDTTAQAADVASGKQFFDALGVLTQGTASGGGGASNYVSGTFKGTTTGAAMDINLSYTGNGYPTCVFIYPSEGLYNPSGSFYPTVQRYAIQYFFGVKYDLNVVPDYSVNDVSKNGLSVVARHKSSTSNPASFSATNVESNLNYMDEDSMASAVNVVRIRSNKKMSVLIKGTSYGFMANIEYTYHVIYSS